MSLIISMPLVGQAALPDPFIYDTRLIGMPPISGAPYGTPQTAVRVGNTPTLQTSVYTINTVPFVSVDLSQFGFSNSTTTTGIWRGYGAPHYPSYFYNFGPIPITSDIHDGTYVVPIIATGTYGVATTTISIIVDNSPPTISLTSITFSKISPQSGDYMYLSGSANGTGSTVRIWSVMGTLLDANKQKMDRWPYYTSSYDPRPLMAVIASSTDSTFMNVPYILTEGEPAGGLAKAAFFNLEISVYDEAGNTATTSLVVPIPRTPPPDPCAVPGACASNILFFPGMLGSRLFEYEAICGNTLSEKERWVSTSDCDHLRLALNIDGKSTHQLYTKEGGNGIVDDVYSFNVYQSFMNELKNWKQNGLMEDYALIPYDWRLSLGDVLQNGATTTAGTLTYSTNQGFVNSYIYKKLKELVATSRNGKVTIIAHSNGGLLAKALISRLKENGDPLADTIDNLILVGVPQVGTPDAVMGLLHGTDLGYGLIMSAERSRALLNNMPSAYHLVPSAGYFTPVTTPIATFDSGPATEIFRNTYGSEINNITELRNFILGADGRMVPSFSDTKNPAIGNASLLAYAETIYEQIGDNWTPPASTIVHQIAGWGEETLAGIDYATKTDRNCVLFIYKCKDTTSLTYKPSTVIDGDGTVVVPSALAMSTSSPNVKRWWVDLEDYNELLDPRISREHKDILEIPQLRIFISNILQGINTLPTYILETQPPTDNKKRLSFTLHSPLDLAAVDINGNRISSATSTIPGARYKRYGEVQYISLPAETAFTVELDGYTSGSFDLDVALKQGNDTLATTTFAAIPVAATTIATISFNDGTIANASPLAIDYDGNGTTDITLLAKEGEEVIYTPDITTPEAIITFATSTKSILFIGRDDVTAIPVVTTSVTTTTVADEAGNTITLSHSFKTQKNNVRYVLNSLTYATSTQTTIAAKATASYHYLEQKNKHNHTVFNARLKTKNQNLVATYNPKKDITKIILLNKDIDIDDDELERMDDEKLPKNYKIKEILSGLVIPYLLTDRGEIIIKY